MECCGSITKQLGYKKSRGSADNAGPRDFLQDIPNRATVAAMLEAERIAKDPSAKDCADADKLFVELGK